MDRAARRRAARGTVPPVAGVWFSNAPFSPTGYGTQTKQVVSRMVADGHKMVVAANYGLEAIQTEWDGIEVWPKGFDPYSNDIVSPYFADWKARHPGLPAAVFTLFDTWVFKGKWWDELPVVSWVPVDHLPTPPAVAEFCAKPNVTAVAMSRYGHEQLERLGIASTYIPHAIDPDLYKPTATFDGRPGRELMKVPDDAFVVSIVNANKGVVPARKAWGENILAFSIFAERHPDAVLYLHTERYGAMGGLALDHLITACGLEVGKQVRFINQYALRQGIPDAAMAAIYTASDVLLAPTLGEGFGLTVLEAAACELPAIVNRFSAQPEVAGPDALLVDGQPWWDAAQVAWFNTPSVPSIVDALEQAYARGHYRSAKSRQHVLDEYDADTVYDNGWRPVLAELAAR